MEERGQKMPGPGGGRRAGPPGTTGGSSLLVLVHLAGSKVDGEAGTEALCNVGSRTPDHCHGRPGCEFTRSLKALNQDRPT